MNFFNLFLPKFYIKHGNFKEIEWLLLVTFLHLTCRSSYNMVYYPSDHHTFSPISLYVFRKSNEHHVRSGTLPNLYYYIGSTGS